MDKKKIITTLCIMICMMTLGYAAFSRQININGTAEITSTWDIMFTSYTKEVVGGATEKKTPVLNGTYASFDVDLVSPGDKIVYKVTLANKGTINAIISEVNSSQTGSDGVYINVSGIEKGDKLGKDEEKIVTVEIGYNEHVTEQPAITDNAIEFRIVCVQDLGADIPSGDTPVSTTKLASKILEDNNYKSDSQISFSKNSDQDGTKGVYYTSANTENNKTTYYFRGDVNNNYVYFANYYWKIVRINEDGSIRLIYQGSDISSSDTIGYITYNGGDTYDNAYMGYMYGATNSNLYQPTHDNLKDSNIKIVVDDWYEANLINYSKYLADAGFCNDRSVAPSGGIWSSSDTALGYGKQRTYFGAYNRIKNNNKPQFACPNAENDLFTTETSNKGNQALTYPIGLLSIDEAIYAGSAVETITINNYLPNIGAGFWTMTPWYLGSHNYIGAICAGSIRMWEWGDYGVVPVINLKSNTEILEEGAGTVGNPYVVVLKDNVS